MKTLAPKLKWIWLSLSLFVLIVGCVIVVNWHGFREGLAYLAEGMQYTPAAQYPVQKTGPFGLAHDLVSLSSYERMATIKHTLAEYRVPFETIPAGHGYQNIFVPGKLDKGFLILEAHYDKEMDDPTFQAATDNTGSVVVLLSAIQTLKDEIAERPVAFLFTALEERGLSGAYRFIDYAGQRKYQIRGVFCFDMVGRGNVIAATSASTAGFCFHIPFYKSMLYNGRKFKDVPRILPFENALLETYLGGMQTLKAFVSYTDANAFLKHNIPAVHLEGDNLWHADQVWGRKTDTLDRLDEQALLACKRLIEDLVSRL